eukprot:gene3208-biopygen11904
MWGSEISMLGRYFRPNIERGTPWALCLGYPLTNSIGSLSSRRAGQSVSGRPPSESRASLAHPLCLRACSVSPILRALLSTLPLLSMHAIGVDRILINSKWGMEWVGIRCDGMKGTGRDRMEWNVMGWDGSG